MLLAYDPSQTPATVWTLEGNISNQVLIQQHPLDHNLSALGHWKSSMLH